MSVRKGLDPGWGVAFLTGVAAFGVYGLCLAPSLPAADAGEQITAAHFLGISHPTGTPLYLLLMKAWEVCLPMGSVAWRMNLLNAVLGSVAVGLFAFFFRRLCAATALRRGEIVILSSGIALTLAFSRTFWYESAGASSYVLHYLFLIIWLGIAQDLMRKERPERTLCLLYAVSGLALGNHVLALAPLGVTGILAVSLLVRRRIGPKAFFSTPLMLIPGLLFYLYIPIRSASDPIPDWGNPQTPPALWHYLTRQDYIANTYVSTIHDLLAAAWFHAKSFLVEMTIIWPLLVILFLFLGMYSWIRKKEGARGNGTFQGVAVGGCLLALLSFVLVAAHGSHNDLFDLPRYMVPVYLGLFSATALGVLWGMGCMGRGARVLLLALIWVAPASGLIRHWEVNDRSRNRIVETFAREVLAHVPRGASLYAEGDNYLFPLLYYHYVEGVRPDISLLNPRLGLGSRDDIARLLRKERLWVTHPLRIGSPYRSVPQGLVFRVTRAREVPKRSLPWKGFRAIQFSLARAPLERIMLCDYCYRRSVYHRLRGEEGLRREWVEKMTRAAGDYDQALMLTGRAFFEMGRTGEAEIYFRRALKKNPKNRVALHYLGRLAEERKEKARLSERGDS
ncbi:MAG: DUF2723 domain-containing protein [Deltaproteobacteria bacterium]|nr:DUF2723 domain-containing protein [Deltaproteobacteria bacterium]